jgi:hypothetical protein
MPLAQSVATVYVSKTHLNIMIDGEKISLTDLSTNGTAKKTLAVEE